MSERIHRSKNAMFWRVDPKVEKARKEHGWCAFHAACGAAGLYFDDIDPAPGGGYGAIAFRVEPHRDYYRMIHVVSARGRNPIAAVRATFRAAIDAGFAIDPSLETLFDRAAPPVFDPVAELVG